MHDITHLHRHAWQINRAKLHDRIKTAIAILFVLLCYGIAGQMDYEDAVAMEQATQTQCK